jgi:hypothetical protein
MPDVRIYRVSVTGNNQSHVQWTDCSGYTPPAQLITSRLKSIGFEARVGTVTTSAPATLEIVGDGNPDCSGTGNSENLTTTTTAAPPIITTTTSTSPPPPTTLSLRYDAISVASACTGTSGTYYVRTGNQFVNTTQLFTNYGLTSVAPNGYYSDGTNYAIVSYMGVLSDKASCISATTTLPPVPTTTSTTTTTSTSTTTTAAPTTTTTTTAAATTTTTTTAAATTTTTTTVSLVPVEFAFTAPCLSNQANPTILWSSLSGGSGDYQASSVVHTSAINALAGAFSDIGNGLDEIYPVITTNGTYFVAVRDKNNISNVTNEAVVISCITGGTTTTTTTTTTTAAPAGYYYNVDTFECSPCAATAFTNLIGYSPTSHPNNVYLNNGDGNVYYINYTYASAQPSYDIDLSGSAGDNDCTSACSI